MNVSLTPEVKKFVEKAVAAGRYGSPEEAINGLISLVKEQEELTPEDIKELRAELVQAIDEADHGRFVEFTAEDIIAEGRAALAKRKGR
jgi:putative addiction module CopG family antidote